MSKTSKSNSSQSGTFSISGGPTATYNKGNVSYNMNPEMQSVYNYAQSALANGLPSLNVFSQENLETLSKEVDAYKQVALKQLNDVYTPMLAETRNDAAKRFGNLDNSVYLQNLDAVENKRKDAVATLSQELAAKQSDLVNEQLENRYNYLNFMNNLQNQITNNALSATGLANSSANMYGQYVNTNNNSNSVNLANLSKLASVLADAGKVAGWFSKI